MAAVIKCDRCGAIIEENQVAYRVDICKRGNMASTPLDLCDSCRKDLDTWTIESKNWCTVSKALRNAAFRLQIIANKSGVVMMGTILDVLCEEFASYELDVPEAWTDYSDMPSNVGWRYDDKEDV